MGGSCSDCRKFFFFLHKDAPSHPCPHKSGRPWAFLLVSVLFRCFSWGSRGISVFASGGPYVCQVSLAQGMAVEETDTAFILYDAHVCNWDYPESNYSIPLKESGQGLAR